MLRLIFEKIKFGNLSNIFEYGALESSRYSKYSVEGYSTSENKLKT